MGKGFGEMEGMVMHDHFIAVFKNKKVFLTGHTGFKGAWLLQLLLNFGANVKGYSLPPQEDDCIFNMLHQNDSFESIYGDVCDFDKLKREIFSFKPDFIFHLAAQALVKKSYEEPLYTMQVNVMGTINVLESIRLLEHECVSIFITTDKVYENNESGIPFKEDDRLGGHDPYSGSKASSELVINAYQKSFFSIQNFSTHGKSVGIARAGNVIGGGDYSKDRIIPDIIRAFRNNQAIHIRNPLSIRPWQHVLDPLCGYLLLAVKLTQEPQRYSGEAWNFGPIETETLTVSDIAHQAIKLLGYIAIEYPLLTSVAHESQLLNLNIDKAIKKLNWIPKWNSYRAIEETIMWYKEPRENIIDFTNSQILNFFK